MKTMKYSKFKHRTLFTCAFLLLAALPGLSQNGGNSGGMNPCIFNNDVEILGNENPSLGTVETYTLTNVNAQDNHKWEVSGAQMIDGQPAANFPNNEIIKPGNSIDVVWGSGNANKSLRVRKDLTCPPGQGRREIVLPVHPTPAFFNCNGAELVSVLPDADNPDVGETHTYDFNYLVKYDDHDDYGCNDVEWTVQGITEIQISGYYPTNCVPSNANPAFTVPDGTNLSQVLLIQDPTVETVLTIDDFQNFSTPCNSGVNDPFLGGTATVTFADVQNACIKISAQACGFLDWCGPREVERCFTLPSTSQVCTPVAAISGPDILCSESSETLTYNVAGGDEAGVFYWNVPAGWVKTSPNGISATFLGFDYLTTLPTITLQTNGEVGELLVVAADYPCDETFTSANLRQIQEVKNSPPVQVSIPKCAKAAFAAPEPRYSVSNGQSGVWYQWVFEQNGTVWPARFTQGTNEITNFPFDLRGDQNFSLTVTALGEHCHAVDVAYVGDAAPEYWIYQITIPACQGFVFSPLAPMEEQNADARDNNSDNSGVQKNGVASEKSQTIAANPTFLVAPNPSAGQFSVMLGEELEQKNVTIEIYNMQGELVASTSNAKSTSVFDLSAEAKGIYMVKVLSANGVNVERVVVR